MLSFWEVADRAISTGPLMKTKISTLRCLRSPSVWLRNMGLNTIRIFLFRPMTGWRTGSFRPV